MSSLYSFLEAVLRSLGFAKSASTPVTPVIPVTPAPPRTPSDDAPLITLSPRVLALIFDPIVDPATGKRLSKHPRAQGWNRVDELIDGYVADIDACSGGLVKYRVVERTVVDGFPLRESRERYTAASYLDVLEGRVKPNEQDLCDYYALVDEFNLTARIANDDFDEVWMFGFPYAGFYEARMVGKGAFWCNSPELKNTPGRRFVIMGFNYERGVGEMLEDLGHRAESILARVFGAEAFLNSAYNPSLRPARVVKSSSPTLFERFAYFDLVAPGKAEVGLLHFAPNSVQDYDWGNPTQVLSCADDWDQFPNLPNPPNYRPVTCADWGNGDIRQHHKWWLEHLPKVAGRTNGVANNWWKYIINVADPELG